MPKATRRENVLATLNWANVPPAASLVRLAKATDRPPVCFRGVARTAHTRNRHIRPSHRHVATIAKRLAVMSNIRPEWSGAERVKMQTGVATPRPLQAVR